MKKLVREYTFSPEQLHTVRALADRLSITETTASLLYARGMDTEEKMRAFLSPGREHFLSPMLLTGMREAVELITRARDEEWRVAVFGDYDVDGLGACAILWRAFRAFGIEPYLYIPERNEGYGMSIAAVDKIFDEFLPDLIVTVDCGISCADEVEYVKQQGAYVIVTDHHELPDRLPDCITVNPKLGGDYPYDNLCGAGVAFKLACALIGEKAYGLLDFAAVSTVADSVPLLGENRDIVAEGLRLLEKRPRPAFAALLGKVEEVTTHTISFTLAPRLNAAGRMGDVRSALRLFTADNEEEITLLAEKLNLYNADRVSIRDEMIEQATREACEEGAYTHLIMLASEEWNTGFAGIIAARIVEAFARPTLLFTKKGELLKGSARSIESVNIFEALKACSQYIEEFGGHAQAAGVTVSEQNFEKLKKALDEYLAGHYTREDFCPTLTVCGEGEGERLAREIALLEPFGVGNRCPLFTMEAGKLDAVPLKAGSPHVAFSLNGLDFRYFNGASELKLLRSEIKKTIVYEYNISHFRGKESIKGFVRTALAEDVGGEEVALEVFENQLSRLGTPVQQGEILTTAQIDEFMREKLAACAYGLVAVCFDRDTLARFPSLEGVPVSLFRAPTSVVNTVLYAPEGADLSAYREVVYLDAPLGTPCRTGAARVIVNSELCGYKKLYTLDTARDTLLQIFTWIRNSRLEGNSFSQMAQNAEVDFAKEELVFALAVFEELGLVAVEDGRLRVIRGRKTELSLSKLYSSVVSLQEVG